MPDKALVDVARQAAQTYGVPEDLFFAQLQQESSWRVNPPSNPAWPIDKGGPAGIAQFTEATAKQYGVNRYDPVSSIWGAAAYNADLYKQTGSWAKVQQRYGTVPSSGPLTTSQQAVLDAAKAADAGKSSSGSGSPPSVAPSAPAGGLPVTSATGPGGVVQSAVSSLYNVLIRAALILIGVVVIWQGLAMMRNTTIVEQVRYVRDRIPKRVAA